MSILFDKSGLNERVYEFLRDKILSNEFKPGMKIIYEDLIQTLGVSRTPLRDALNQLKKDGLIEVKPRSGSYVYMPKEKDIIELYDVRKSLESLAVELATPLIPREQLEQLMIEAELTSDAIKNGNIRRFFETDRNFHRTIIRYANNHLLQSIMNTLELKINWFAVIITKNFDRPQQANEMHMQILRAMLQTNAEEAKDLMGKHIEEIKQYTVGDYT